MGLVVPASVKNIGERAFVNISVIFLQGIPDTYNSYCYSNSLMYVPSAAVSAIQQRNRFTTILPLEYCPDYVIGIYRTYCGGFSFYVVQSPVAESGSVLKGVTVDGTVVVPDSLGQYKIVGLKSDTSYVIDASYQRVDGIMYATKREVKTNVISLQSLHFRASSQTQVRITEMIINTDETCVLKQRGIMCNGSMFYPMSRGFVVTGLLPNSTYTLHPFADFENGQRVWWPERTVQTQSLNPQIAFSVTPTTIVATGSYQEDDATVSESGFKGYAEGDRMVCTGLDPETEYDVIYYVRTPEGGYEEKTETIRTSSIEFTTLQPRGVSATSSIVSATTNLSDREVNAGFQWRKYDAPVSLASKEGYAAVCDGRLEGYISNLQPTSYYNVRPFYKSATGKYYYGEWVTFDPSDFSYFEPIVRTYPIEDVMQHTVQVRGYVLQGTDPILRQGFQYWVQDSDETYVKAARVAPASGEDVITVISAGQVMTAVLENLAPNTTYCCRAFVTTDSGTVYGEEQLFTTMSDLTGVESVRVGQSTTSVVTGCYDLSGRKLDRPVRGVNLIRYSDGTTRKVLLK